MRLRTLGFAAFAAAAVMQSCQPACTPPPPAPPPPVETPPAPPPPPPEITSITFTGHGSGHGRGMSAWGAYGRAVNQSAPWDQILDYYYGGTRLGHAPNQTVGVRLMAMDNSASTGVISTTGRAIWGGVGYGALWAEHRGFNNYDVYGSPTPACPGAPVAWTLLAQQQGPITFTTNMDETTAPAGDVLGLCQPNGTVIHYRGTITALNDSSGQTRTANHLLVENYLKGVMSRELPSSWGYSGNGRGMNALWAFAVAQRSFALAQNRYSYAKTCDTTACQLYGGAAYRADPGAPTSWPTVPICEGGNLTFECATTNQAIAETPGLIRIWPNGNVVSTEYSASHGPYSAGGPFPAVDDWASNVPQNPNYSWTRTIDAATLEARFGLGDLTGGYTDTLPGTPWYGDWGGRVDPPRHRRQRRHLQPRLPQRVRVPVARLRHDGRQPLARRAHTRYGFTASGSMS